MNQSGQGSLEYLLLIGGGVLVAVIIVASIASLPNGSGKASELELANAQCASYLKTGYQPCEEQTARSTTHAYPCRWSNETNQCVAGNSLSCIGGFPDGICKAGENCPQDAGGCFGGQDLCRINTCTNGCNYTFIAANTADNEGTNQCNDSTGCTNSPCICNGYGSCLGTGSGTQLAGCGLPSGGWKTNTTYTLGQKATLASGSECFNINKNAVTLDCMGKEIDAGGKTAIQISGSNVKIQNCIISNAKEGITVGPVSGNTTKALNNTITINRVNGAYGIRIRTGTGNDIENNTVSMVAGSTTVNATGILGQGGDNLFMNTVCQGMDKAGATAISIPGQAGQSAGNKCYPGKCLEQTAPHRVCTASPPNNCSQNC